jgi:hypothetical protein
LKYIKYLEVQTDTTTTTSKTEKKIERIKRRSIKACDLSIFLMPYVEFIWFMCGPNELGQKRCIRTYSDDLISIYVHILCIFRRYSREQKIVFKTLRERDTIQEGDNPIPP